MSGLLERAARRAAGTPEPRAPSSPGDVGPRMPRDVLIRRAGVAAASLVLLGGARPAGARSLVCGAGPGVAGTYGTYAGCVKDGAGKLYRDRIVACRKKESETLELARSVVRSWWDAQIDGEDPWVRTEVVLGLELECSAEAYADWARAADECARRCPIPKPRPKPRRARTPIQPVPQPARPPGVPPEIPSSSYDACLNCMSVGGVCCPAKEWPYFICTNPYYSCR